MREFLSDVVEWLPVLALLAAYGAAAHYCRRKSWPQARRLAVGVLLAAPTAAAAFVSLAETGSAVGAAATGALSGVIWACLWAEV